MAEIVAHRGAGQGFVQPQTPPENTLPAFDWAWRHADAAELDVRLTRDRRLVVIHDATTRRTANADWQVADRTLAESQQLDAGSWKSPHFAGVRLPSLEWMFTPEAGQIFPANPLVLIGVFGARPVSCA